MIEIRTGIDCRKNVFIYIIKIVNNNQRDLSRDNIE